MQIIENPPRMRKSRRRRGARRGPNGRFLKKARKSSSRRKTRRGARPKAAKVRRYRRRSGGAKMARKRRKSRKGRRRSKAFYRRIGKKGARVRAARRAARSRAGRKAARRSRRRPKGRRHRFTVRRRKGRWVAPVGSPIKGRRVNPGRRRRRRGGKSRRRVYRRRNPGIGGRLSGLFPTSLGQFKSAAMWGAGGAVGYLGTSMINKFVDDAFLGEQKAKIQNNLLRSIVNAAQTVVATFLLAGVARMVVKNKPEITQGIFAGGATKAVLDIVNPLLAERAASGGAGAGVADAALSGFQEQLSGYQYSGGGVSGFQTERLGYVTPQLNRIAAMNNEEATPFG